MNVRFWAEGRDGCEEVEMDVVPRTGEIVSFGLRPGARKSEANLNLIGDFVVEKVAYEMRTERSEPWRCGIAVYLSEIK